MHEHAAHAQHTPETSQPYDKHAGHKVESFRTKFFVVLGLTLPIVLYSETLQQVFNFDLPDFPGARWI